MKKTLKFVAVFMAATIPLFAEVSAFGAGNLNAENPYGLTENEKELLKNKRSVATIQDNLGSVSEQIQGLQSIIEGMNARMARLEQRMNEIELRVNGDDMNASASNLSLQSLKKEIDQTRAIQESNYQKITKTLNQLGTLIDKKSSAPATSKPQADNSNTNSNGVNLSKKDNKTIMNDAVNLFNSNKNDEAREHFEHLVSKKYQPATSNFYLGEIAYKQKSYSQAIKYYQKSIEQSDSGSHVPRLLYHTAISFDKVGDTASANKFYKALKVGYPESKEAQASPNRN
ncbi:MULTISPECIES: tetratricopeptide repeat protein [unclassified Campylobacter]|uniref:tetratricopeptide repeat protein n=1 Tax=unclassified Campylobacter TaxID=2593542 RepID=UPI003D342A2B